MTYFVRNYSINKKYGKECLIVDHKSTIFKTAPLAMSENERSSAMEVLHPSSIERTGEEHNLFVSGGYITLRGQVNNVSTF